MDSLAMFGSQYCKKTILNSKLYMALATVTKVRSSYLQYKLQLGPVGDEETQIGLIR